MRVGTSKIDISVFFLNEDHPHACGDKYTFSGKVTVTGGSSPCVWGQAGKTTFFARYLRIIPMRVGTRLWLFSGWDTT